MIDPLIAEYAGQAWMMEPERLRHFFAALSAHPVTADLASLRIEYSLPYHREGSKGIVPVKGVLLKSVPDWARIYGRFTGYDDIGEMIRMALADEQVQSIELRITSPGGMVAGGMEAAEAIRAADAVKPVTAVIEDLGASGAFWLANSAQRIEANANAEVGSIGVFTVYLDWTGFDTQVGIKTIVIRSGEHKGMGIDAVTDNQIAAMQEVIDGMNGHFIEQVARGRRVPRDKASQWATGRVWLAPAALELGLIDAITATTTDARLTGKEETMAEQQTEQIDVGAVEAQAKTEALGAERQRVADLKKAFTDDPAFALEAVEKGWTVTEAKAERHDRIADTAGGVPPTSAGAPGVPYGDSDGGGAVDFMTQAKQIAREQKISMTEAMRQVQEDAPEAYDKFRASESRRSVCIRSGKAAAGRVRMSAARD